MKEYVYQIKHKFIKDHVYRGEKEIENYRFLPYKANEDDELFYAIPIELKRDCSIVKQMIFSVGRIYTECDEEEKQDESFKDKKFEKTDKGYIFIPTEEDYKDFVKAQLCFSANGYVKNILFINGADQTEYFATSILEECCGDIIKELLDNNVIYKKRCPEELK